MFKRSIILGFFLIVAVCGDVYSANPNKYQIKSGIIEYQLSGNQTGTESFYFDDFGQREARYTQATMFVFGIKQPIEQVQYTEGEWSYDYDPKTNSATRVNIEELTSQMLKGSKGRSLREFGEETMKEIGGEKTGAKEILGKSCDVWIIPKMGATVCVYKKSISLESQVNIGGMVIHSLATSVSENVKIPTEKITLPKTASIKDAPSIQDDPEDVDFQGAASQMPSLGEMIKQMRTGGEESGGRQDDRDYELKQRELDLKAKELELKEKQLNQSAQPAQQEGGALDGINNTVNTTDKIRNAIGGLRSLLGR